MRVLVIGGGIAGISTAFHLAEKGFQVTVVEKNPSCAAETSSANGAQLSYTYAEPLACPGLLRKLPGWFMCAATSPVANHDRLNPVAWLWQMQLLLQSNRSYYNANKTALLSLALYSRSVLETMLQKHNLQFNHAKTGKLHLYHEKYLLDYARIFADTLREQHGIGLEILTSEACLEKEPLLHRRQGTLAGGMFSPIDETGDSHAFASELADMLVRHYGVTIHYNVKVRLIREGVAIKAVHMPAGDITADAYVLAAGFYSREIAKGAGISLPIYPLKGYALTLETAGNTMPISASITDHEQKIVLAPLGNKLRVAGLVELDGMDMRLYPERVAALKQKITHLIPDISFDSASVMVGMRPFTPSSVPYIGPTHLSNLFLNTGHGMLGWTLSQGSAALLAHYMANEPLPIDITPYRYGGRSQ